MQAAMEDQARHLSYVAEKTAKIHDAMFVSNGSPSIREILRQQESRLAALESTAREWANARRNIAVGVVGEVAKWAAIAVVAAAASGKVF
jgi:hypothetical protein